MIAGFGLALGPASLASAVDGVLEINAACAETGCFPGDSAGYPVTLSGQAGGTSFRLTGTLSTSFGETPTSLIEIGSADVVLDLNGFALRGSGGLGGPNVGIDAIGLGPTQAARATIRNGTISSMLSVAIDMTDVPGVRLEGLTIRGNNGGVVLGRQAVVTDSLFEDNEGSGISTNGGVGARILNNTLEGHTSVAIDVGDDARIEGNSIDGTGSVDTGAGIRALNGAAVLGNTVLQATGTGIEVGGEARVTDNTIRTTLALGIDAGDSSAILRNTVQQTIGDGIDVGVGARVEGNTVQSAGAIGIDGGAEAVVVGNVVGDSGAQGISIGPRSLITGNQVSNAGGSGIGCGVSCRISRNVVAFSASFGIAAGNLDPGAGSISENSLIENSGGPFGILGGYFNGGGNTCVGLLATDARCAN